MTSEERNAYRASLQTLMEKMQSEYDKTVLVLSGGSFGLSMAFTKDPQPSHSGGWFGERKWLGCLNFTCQKAGCEKEKPKATEPPSRYRAAAARRTHSGLPRAQAGPRARGGQTGAHLQSVEPCAIEGLTLALEAGMLQHRLIIAERELLEKTLNGAVKILTDVLEALDSNAFGRGRHLRDAAHALMRTYAVSEAWEVELAAMLSPIGRVTLPSTLILKERNGQPLTEQEKDMLRRVPEIGAGLLEQIPRLENVAQIIRLQHHGYAGPGSTAGTTGQADIPAGSRILKALGDLATLQATGRSKPDALRQMWAATGQYDQTILAAVEANAAITFANGDKSSLPPLSLAINELQAGHILAADIVNQDGSLVVPAGLTLSSTMVQRLLNFWEIRAIASHAAVRPDFPLP